MAIYARFGDEVKVLRYATEKDVLELDPPLDDEAKRNLEHKSWVVCELGTKREHKPGQPHPSPIFISHLAYLRADGALKEIMDSLREAE